MVFINVNVINKLFKLCSVIIDYSGAFLVVFGTDNYHAVGFIIVNFTLSLKCSFGEELRIKLHRFDILISCIAISNLILV